MSKFVNICGPVVGATVYCNNKLVARDTGFTLPEIVPVTVELSAMGTMSLPLWQLLENMETTITKIGLDLGLRDLIVPNMKPLEFRWVQTVSDATGATKEVGCKAFVTGTPNKIPGVSIAVGEAIEGEVTITTTRYSLFVDGAEYFQVDRRAGILRINGVDYVKSTDDLL